MPEPIVAVACLSIFLALPALAVAIYHGTRMDKCLHDCPTEQPGEKDKARP